MKKHSLRAYFCGVFTSFLLFALIVPSFADSATKQLTAAYNGVTIYISGAKLEPKDANGNAVQPFIVDGTTYLPLRAVADAVGYDVTYDASIPAVKLTPKTSASPSPSAGAINETLRNSLGLRLNACIAVASAKSNDSKTTRKSDIFITAWPPTLIARRRTIYRY